MPDSQTLTIFAVAMVAGVILFRLYTVLGRRTGHEPPPPPVAAPNAPPLAEAPPQPVPTQGGLLDIQIADRRFDTQRFLKGARDAYALITGAFARGDREALRPLLSPDVLAAFEAEIAARGGATAPAMTRLDDARIVSASLEGRHAEITIAFTAAFPGEGGVPRQVTDVWTFARDLDAADPNWTLVATSGDLP